ncbi:MAG: hypothetical protein R3E79_26045 [Caldilineaceae bacterium]
MGGFAIAFGGWIFQSANLIERVLGGIAGLCLLYANLWLDLTGFALLILVIGIHWLRVRRQRSPIYG